MMGATRFMGEDSTMSDNGLERGSSFITRIWCPGTRMTPTNLDPSPPKPPIGSLLGGVGMLQDLYSWIQRATKPPLSGSQEVPQQKVLTKQNGPQNYQGTLLKLKDT